MEQQEQTAVEWLVEQLENHNGITRQAFENVIKEAKKMEKQQIIDAWNNCLCIQDFNDKCAEYYYNETYGKTHQSFQTSRG